MIDIVKVKLELRIFFKKKLLVKKRKNRISV